MPTVTKAEDIRQQLTETDNVQSLEFKLKELDIDVTEAGSGPKASFDINGDQMALSPLALTELATTLSIPATYLPKCPADLQARQLSYWQTKLTDRKRIRAVIGDDMVQGVVSPNFIPLLNVPLYDALADAVGRGSRDSVEVFVFQHGWGATRIGLANTADSVDISNPHFQENDDFGGDIVYLGVDFINSLTATSHTEMRGLIFRGYSETAAVTPIPRSGAPQFRWDRKSGIEPPDWIASAVDDLHSQHDDVTEQLNAIAQHEVSDMTTALEAELENLPGTLREAIHPAYEKEPTPTLWGIVNAITRAAKEADPEVPEGHRYQAQKFAGSLALNAICEECKRAVIG